MTRILIVGAGLAGLSAAHELTQAGVECVVLEARSRVGGRVMGGIVAGQAVEFGGTWLGEGHDRMYALADELGLPTFRTYNDDGQMLIDLADRQSRMKPTKGAVPKLSPFALADLGQGLLRFARLAKGVDPERPWLHPRAATLDGQTFETWIARNLRTPSGRAYFRIATEAVFAADPSDLSLLHSLFWRAAGLNGQAASDRGPVKVTFDVSPPDAEVGILLGFVEGGDARRWVRLTEAERRRTVIDCFVRYFGPEAAHPLDYAEQDWSAEEFSRGCYGAHFAPGVWTAYGEALRPPIGRIHWAGAEYATRWNGYMEGAVRSGTDTAREVLASLSASAPTSM